ncbi:MAG: hypothetical protein JWO95_3687, partial [Verrucomicrobiales bacterium]|nr:hypothetical protein [Verrucomicrobiales bacterium]
MDRVYIETTIISYLVARRPSDVIKAARQKATEEWWNQHRLSYLCLTSTETVRECSLGDETVASLRLKMLDSIPVIAVDLSALNLARTIIERKILPPLAISDAIHASVAAHHHSDLLLTWNCRHLANPHILPKLRSFVEQRG